ncbi:MAG: Eco47II family restriction endonuclease [Proteobacteria bacterium]|nr:MAG: Eco47II family restriction endonuclease [Pseudomonadota bacterium]
MSKRQYNLNFISDIDLFNHVKETVEIYSESMDLKKFNNNLIDPIKLTFDKIVYKKSIDEIIEAEIIRQLDKTNTNGIGYFHQNIFKYIGGNDWSVPPQGFDIVNESQQIYVEMKNKHNTMNSSASQKTYMRMQNKIINQPSAICMLVEVIAKNSQNIPWETTVDKIKMNHKQIRRVSIDKFYKIVTKNKTAFKELCLVLPIVIADVVNSMTEEVVKNTVLTDLKEYGSNTLTNIYLLAFDKYEGFKDFVLADEFCD